MVSMFPGGSEKHTVHSMKTLNQQKGFMSVVLALLLPGLLVALALAADAGYLMLQQSRLQYYANAAALSGAKYRTRSSVCSAEDVKAVIGSAKVGDITCAKDEVTVSLNMSYQPILLGFVGVAKDGLVASARAGIQGDKRIVLLSGVEK